MIPMPVIALPVLNDRRDDVETADGVYVDVDVTMPGTVNVVLTEPSVPYVNHAEHQGDMAVADWDSYVGQEPMKKQLRVYIDSAKSRNACLVHTLLASGLPGAGKTTLARLVGKEMRAGTIHTLAAPFTAETLQEAVLECDDWDVLFIDEIHLLSPGMQDRLLTIMEEGYIQIGGDMVHLNDFTVIGATTDKNMLRPAVISRFAITPFFQKYNEAEMTLIARNFAKPHNLDVDLDDDVFEAIGKASRATPRFARDLVMGARALQDSTGWTCSPEELLAFMEIDADGMSREHKAYVLAMYQFFGREIIVNDHAEWEYVAGEASLMTILRENKAGVARLERFLVESGLVDRTQRGRRLTARGIARAQTWLDEGAALGTEG